MGYGLLLLLAVGIASALIGWVRERAETSYTVRRWYRGTIMTVSFAGVFWLGLSNDPETLHLLVFVLAIALPMLISVYWELDDLRREVERWKSEIAAEKASAHDESTGLRSGLGGSSAPCL